MIRYNLHCRACGGEFEGWFASSAAFDAQHADGRVVCAHCAAPDVEKAIMAPRVARGGQGPAAPTAVSPAAQAGGKAATASGRVHAALTALRRHVERNCDYVGEKFAEEARRIHYGEAETRGIYGEATDEQHESLKDEGIEVHRVPWPRPRTEH